VERQLLWEGTDVWRAESAHVRSRADGSVVAIGVQLGVVPLRYRLDYRLELGADWVTRQLEVTALGAGWRRSARLTRNAVGWTYRYVVDGDADLLEPGCDPASLDGALDCDLGLSPLTNTMPILRLSLHRQPGTAELTMAWMSVPDLAVRVSEQRYELVRATPTGAVVRFSSGDFAADLELDSDGFVIDYPELARRVTPAAGT
jgi:hypothetical protein